MTKLSVSGSVREVLTSNPEMSTDDVIRRAKAQGLRVTDEQIRKSVHNQRTAVRAKVATGGVRPTPAREAARPKTVPPKAAPAVSAPAATTSTLADLEAVVRRSSAFPNELSVSRIVREVLSSDPELPIDAVIHRAKAQGLRVTDEQIRKSVHNQRAAVRAKVATAKVATAKVAPTAAREAAPPKTVPPKAAPAVSTTAATPAGGSELTGVLRNVASVNEIVGLCGGVENARRTAEAVGACGGPEAFLQLLELVGTIRRGEAAA